MLRPKRYDIIYKTAKAARFVNEFRNILQNMDAGSITYVVWQIVGIQAISLFGKAFLGIY